MGDNQGKVPATAIQLYLLSGSGGSHISTGAPAISNFCRALKIFSTSSGRDMCTTPRPIELPNGSLRTCANTTVPSGINV